MSLTCDAWQASNANGYFAIIAHWIDEMTPVKWELQTALIGFTYLNNAHNSYHLVHILFKIIQCLDLKQKVSHIISNTFCI